MVMRQVERKPCWAAEMTQLVQAQVDGQLVEEMLPAPGDARGASGTRGCSSREDKQLCLPDSGERGEQVEVLRAATQNRQRHQGRAPALLPDLR